MRTGFGSTATTQASNAFDQRTSAATCGVRRGGPHRVPGGRARRRVGDLQLRDVEKVTVREAWCQDQAETVMSLHDVEADEARVLLVAKAIAAEVQRASFTRAALARGEPETTSAHGPTTSPAAKPANAIRLTELVEAWWREAERTGKSASYTNTIEQLVTFLRQDEAHRVTVEDVRRFKDYRLATRQT